MGIARGAVALLLEEAHKRPFHGRLATLGRQTLYTTAAEVARQFSKFQVKPKGSINPVAATITDQDVFGWMGFDRVESFDYSDFEGASHTIDLNSASLPSEWAGAFDVVLDSGTLEHVFHFPNALKNTLSLLKVGGRMIFLTVSSNHLDHGFYMFSPTLFADYFAANGFRIETFYVVRYHGEKDKMWDAYTYQPGLWRNLHTGGLDDKPYAIWVVATRLATSTLDVMPQQGYYSDTWAANANPNPAKIVPEVKSPLPEQTPAADMPVSLARKIIRLVPGARSLWIAVQPWIRALPNKLMGKTYVRRGPISRQEIFRENFVGKY